MGRNWTVLVGLALMLLLRPPAAAAQQGGKECRPPVRTITGPPFSHFGDLIRVTVVQRFICPGDAAATGADISLTTGRIVGYTDPNGAPLTDPKIAIGFDTSRHQVLIAHS